MANCVTHLIIADKLMVQVRMKNAYIISPVI